MRFASIVRLSLVVCALIAVSAPSALRADLFAIADGDVLFEYDNDVPADDGNTFFENSVFGFQFGEGWMLSTAGVTVELLFGTSTIDAGGTFGTVFFDDVEGIFDVTIRYEIEDLGAGSIGMAVDATILNDSGAADGVDVRLYNYFDYDIGDTFVDHEATITDDGSGTFTMDIVLPGVGSVSRSAVGPSHFQMGEYPAVYDDIMAGFDLDDDATPFGPGDFTGAYQWDFSLADGEFAVASSDIFATTAIPEPSTVAFLSLGGLAVVGRALRRRRRKLSA